MLTRDERERYDRQIIIEGFGEGGQEKLRRAKVIVAGAGGLGCPAAIYLAAAGVGTIRIIDPDKVELSNLNRQVLHWDEDLGRGKAGSAVQKLSRLNPGVEIEAVAETITEDNVAQLTDGFDLIIDALDNLPARFLLNRAALASDIPFFHGAVYGFEGRAMTIIPGKSACLRCLYPGPVPSKKKSPVMGVAPAVIGIIQATEAIKYFAGIGQLLTNRLLVYNGLDMTFTELKVGKNPNCEHCGASVK